MKHLNCRDFIFKHTITRQNNTNADFPDLFCELYLELVSLPEDSNLGRKMEVSDRCMFIYHKIHTCHMYIPESYKMTISAVWRLIPNPPALVDRMKQNFSELGLLYESIRSSRSS